MNSRISSRFFRYCRRPLDTWVMLPCHTPWPSTPALSSTQTLTMNDSVSDFISPMIALVSRVIVGVCWLLLTLSGANAKITWGYLSPRLSNIYLYVSEGSFYCLLGVISASFILQVAPELEERNRL